MEQGEIVRFLKGQIKKHGKNFSVTLKYQTANGKMKKRHGDFVDLKEGFELVLYNRDKGREGRYRLERILKISKKQE